MHLEFLSFLFPNFYRTKKMSWLSSSTIRSYRRMLSWFSLSIYIYIYYMCIPILSCILCARAQSPHFLRSLFNILSCVPLYANNVFTLGDSGCTIFALVGIAFARRTGNTVALCHPNTIILRFGPFGNKTRLFGIFPNFSDFCLLRLMVS